MNYMLEKKIVVKRNNVPGMKNGQVIMQVYGLKDVMADAELRSSVIKSLRRWQEDYFSWYNTNYNIVENPELLEFLKDSALCLNCVHSGEIDAIRDYIEGKGNLPPSIEYIYFAISDSKLNGGEGFEVEALVGVADMTPLLHQYCVITLLEVKPDNRDYIKQVFKSYSIMPPISRFLGTGEQLFWNVLVNLVEREGYKNVGIWILTPKLEKMGLDLGTIYTGKQILDLFIKHALRTYGYIDGAIQSGDNNAQEIRDYLRRNYTGWAI